jgi:hypothetical protein
MRALRSPFFLAMLRLAKANAEAQEGGDKIIVNASNPPASLSKDEMSGILVKISTRFSDGRDTAHVDVPAKSPIRDNFSG